VTLHERLAAAGVIHRFTNGRLEVRVMQPGQSAPWWPAIAHAGRLIGLPAAMAAMPEIAAAVAAWAGNGGTEQPCPSVPPEAVLMGSYEAARVAAWKLRNRERVRAQKRRARERKRAA